MSKCPHMPLHNLHNFDVNRLCLLMFNLILTLFYRISDRIGLNFSSKSTLEQNFVSTQYPNVNGRATKILAFKYGCFLRVVPWFPRAVARMVFHMVS